MDLAQQRTISRKSTGTNARYLAIAVVLGAMVVAVTVAILLSSVLSAPSFEGGLGSDAWRAFRAEEQSTAIGGDPLAQQSVIDFRNSEHSEAR